VLEFGRFLHLPKSTSINPIKHDAEMHATTFSQNISELVAFSPAFGKDIEIQQSALNQEISAFKIEQRHIRDT